MLLTKISRWCVCCCIRSTPTKYSYITWFLLYCLYAHHSRTHSRLFKDFTVFGLTQVVRFFSFPFEAPIHFSFQCLSAWVWLFEIGRKKNRYILLETLLPISVPFHCIFGSTWWMFRVLLLFVVFFFIARNRLWPCVYRVVIVYIYRLSNIILQRHGNFQVFPSDLLKVITNSPAASKVPLVWT